MGNVLCWRRHYHHHITIIRIVVPEEEDIFRFKENWMAWRDDRKSVISLFSYNGHVERNDNPMGRVCSLAGCQKEIGLCLDGCMSRYGCPLGLFVSCWCINKAANSGSVQNCSEIEFGKVVLTVSQSDRYSFRRRVYWIKSIFSYGAEFFPIIIKLAPSLHN